MLLESAAREDGADLIPPESGFCAAKALPLLVGSVSGALVSPPKDVRIHENEIVEVIAPVCLREALDLRDGDEVALLLGGQSPRGAKGMIGLAYSSGDEARAALFPLRRLSSIWTGPSLIRFPPISG